MDKALLVHNIFIKNILKENHLIFGNKVTSPYIKLSLYQTLTQFITRLK